MTALAVAPRARGAHRLARVAAPVRPSAVAPRAYVGRRRRVPGPFPVKAWTALELFGWGALGGLLLAAPFAGFAVAVALR